MVIITDIACKLQFITVPLQNAVCFLLWIDDLWLNMFHVHDHEYELFEQVQ